MHTTFETSKRLKDAGFLQPEPAFGQVWYIDGLPSVVVQEIGTGWDLMALGGRSGGSYLEHFKREDFNAMVFAPTATDILEQMGKKFVVESCALAWIEREEAR